MSIFLPSPSASFNIYRVHHKVCVTTLHSNQCKTDIICSSICIKSQKCNNKLYMIPARNSPFRSASIKPLEADENKQRCNASPGVSAPNDIQRFETVLGGSSSKPFEGMSDFESQLQDLFNEVKTMIKAGNKDDAIDLLQANYEAVKECIDTGRNGIEEAAILDVISLGYMAVGDLDTLQSLLDTLNDIVGCLKDDEPLLDSILIHAASMYSTLGKFEKSMFVYQRAVNILECRYGKSSTYLVTPLLGMAKVFGSIGRARKAVEIYDRAIAILEMSRGAESEILVVPLSALGNLLVKEGRAKDAELPFIRIITIYSKLYGDKDGRVGMAMCSLAHVKCANGDADEAINLYRKALQVMKDSSCMELDDGTIENMKIDLAELLHVVGRGTEGRELLEECLLITEKSKGKDHPSSVPHLLNLASSYSQAKNFVEAERLLRIGLDIIRKKVGHEDQSLSFPMLHLAVTLFQLNKDKEAEDLALEVLCIREKAFGKDSLPVGEALDCLVSIQTRLGKDDGDLLKMLQRVLKIQENEFGSESEDIVVTLQKIMFYLDKVGRRDEKLNLRKRLSALKTKYKQTVRY